MKPDRGAVPRASWRDEVIGASSLNALAGLWLMLSPWLLAYAGEAPVWDELLFGGLITVLALLRIARGVRSAWLSWLNLALGLAVFVHAVAFAASTVASINGMLMGVLVVMLASLSLAAGDAARRRRERRARR